MFFGRDKRRIKTILVVEDEPLVAFDNEHFLNSAGYTVTATVAGYDDVVDAIARHAPDPPDLIVCDVNLPGARDGIDVARLAREHGIALLFATGNCPVGGRELAVGCLAKPYSQRSLLQSIRAVDAVLRGQAPGKLPHGLALFDTRYNRQDGE